MRQAAGGRTQRTRRSAPECPVRAAPLAALLALALAAGCASPRDDDLFGMTLDVESQQPWASDPELRHRIHDLVEESCAHTGLDPSQLYGMTLRIVDSEIPCGAVANARGCTWRDQGVIAVSTLAWLSFEPRVPCVEDTPIPHELLHVKIADEHHTDPRWLSDEFWSPLWQRARPADCIDDVNASATLVW